MKKNRKLVALVTMLVFALSIFAPMAAFADPASTQASIYEVDQGKLKVDVDDEVTVDITSLDASGKLATTPVFDGTNKGYIWAEEAKDVASDAVTAVDGENTTVSDVGNFYEIALADVTGNVKVSFARPGTYNVYVGTATAAPADPTDLDKLKVSGKYTVVVSAEEATVDEAYAGNDAKALEPTTNLAKKNYASGEARYVEGLNPNGIATEKVTITLFDKNSNAVGQGVNVKLRTTGGLKVDKTSAVTDYAGQVSFKVSTKVAETAYVYVESGNYTGVVMVDSSDTDVENIKVLKKPDNAIDRDSTDWTDEDEVKKFIKFGTFNAAGDAVDGTGQEFYNDNSDYVKFTKQPAGADYEADTDYRVHEVSSDKSEFTIAFNSKTPKAGDYNLRVALDNGKTIDIPFSVGNIGTIKELILDYGKETVLPDENVEEPEIKVVDKNGVEKVLPASDVTLGYVGKAVKNGSFDENTGEFTVDKDADYGSKIIVTAVSDKYGLVAKAEFVVGDEGRVLEFEQTTGKVGVVNEVNFQIVDENGKKASLVDDYDESSIILVENTNKDATVTANMVEDNDAQDAMKTSGEGVVELTATAPTKATFAVYIRDNQNRYYAGSLTYNFGKDDVATKGKLVAFTIDSTTMIDDNKTVEIEAPAVIKQSRTFVPYRALGEAFGAKVEWDNANKTVTYELGGDKVVMTIGETKYTINGVEKEMDVAPYISNSRTMVPARFVTEALGYTIAPIKGDNGIATVVITIE